jgi:hypothetical protein
MRRSTPITTSRRQTLGLTLLSLAALRPAIATEAKSRKRKKRKQKEKCERKIDRAVADRCGMQVGFCVESVSPVCARASDIPACQSIVRQCCGYLGQCDVPSYLACMRANFEPPVAP